MVTLPWGSGQGDSCGTQPHCGQWAVELLWYTATLPGGNGQWEPCGTPPHCLAAVGRGTPAVHCCTAWGQWSVELLGTLPHSLGAVGNGTLAANCGTASGQCARGLVRHTAECKVVVLLFSLFPVTCLPKLHRCFRATRHVMLHPNVGASSKNKFEWLQLLVIFRQTPSRKKGSDRYSEEHGWIKSLQGWRSFARVRCNSHFPETGKDHVRQCATFEQ